MGSSRPAARSLRNLGLACLIAESINGLFYRNAVNFALPALEAPGVNDLFRTICRSLQVDADHENISPLGRPMKIVDGGTPIEGLLSF